MAYGCDQLIHVASDVWVVMEWFVLEHYLCVRTLQFYLELCNRVYVLQTCMLLTMCKYVCVD